MAEKLDSLVVQRYMYMYVYVFIYRKPAEKSQRQEVTQHWNMVTNSQDFTQRGRSWVDSQIFCPAWYQVQVLVVR